MLVKDFVDAYKEKKFMNTQKGADEKSEWIRRELQIKNYISFMEKRNIAEMVAINNIEMIDGIKKYDSISAYISLIISSIMAHTSLQFSDDPITDYDMLAESGLLSQIVVMFQESHNEIDILFKMALASELEDNNTNVLIGHFLDALLKKVDGLSGVLNGTLGNLDLENMFNNENVAKIIGLLNK